MAKRKAHTTLTELVEAHNIALSVGGIIKLPSGHLKWRRALLHGVTISGACYGDDLRKLREALGLP